MPISKLAKFFAKRPDLYNQTREKYSQVAPYLMISAEPPIFYLLTSTEEGYETMFSSFRVVFEYLQDRSAYFLYGWWCDMEDSQKAYERASIEKYHISKYPRHKFVHLCNTQKQEEIFQTNGLTAIFCNHNSLVDEHIFKPLNYSPKAFKAVYDARFSEFKRHYLAQKVDSIAFIYYNHHLTRDLVHHERVKSLFPDAHFFNEDSSGSYKLLTPIQVNQCFDICKVGLCLSSTEGAMYASIQYLLSGLPVVSTKSKGGRDVFFDEEYALIVDDHPDAVKEGVEEMISRNISADTIRSKVLEKVKHHRLNLINLVQSIYDQEGINRDFSDEWGKIFFHKLHSFQKPEWAIDQLKILKQET